MIMRKIAFALLLWAGLSQQARCQVTADPATSQMDLASMAGISLNANFIAPNQVIRLKIPVFNLNQLNAIPAGGFRIKIGLGLNMGLDPGFNLTTAPLNNYFNWTSALVNGERIITGQQIAILPGDFAGTAEFNVKGTVLGTSAIITTIQPINITDEDLNNNDATLQYTITNQTIPVQIAAWEVTKTGCTINTRFLTAAENNVKQYEIEAAIDGVQYQKMGVLAAKGNGWYSFNFTLPERSNTSVPVRLKTIDLDGKVQYSDTKSVRGVCSNGANLYQAYPNPVTHQSQITLSSTSGILWNGLYSCQFSTITGKYLRTHTVQCRNTPQLILPVHDLAAGTYLLCITGGRVSATAPALVKLVIAN